MADSSTIHASAVLAGAKAVLIRGPSGAGKSRLAIEILEAAAQGALPFARLVADDRAYLSAENGRLVVRPAPALAGLLEVRGVGIRRLPYEAAAVVGLVVDLAAPDAARCPEPDTLATDIEGIQVPRLPIAADAPALPLLLAFRKYPPAGD